MAATPPTPDARDDETAARLDQVVAQDPRYPRAAYLFLLAGLARAQQERAPELHPEAGCHVRGPELCEALRAHALEEYGPLAFRVLRHWNLTRTQDFGNLVFNLVAASLLSATPEDSPVDFADGYDFVTAFVEPYAETGEPPADLPPIA